MNDTNLIPLNKRPMSEQREIQQKGVEASREKRAIRKRLKEELLLMLEDNELQNKICLALINKALNGDIKAFEVIRDTIGENPKNAESEVPFGPVVFNIHPVSPVNDSDTSTE